MLGSREFDYILNTCPGDGYASVLIARAWIVLKPVAAVLHRQQLDVHGRPVFADFGVFIFHLVDASAMPCVRRLLSSRHSVSIRSRRSAESRRRRTGWKTL